MQCTRTLLIAVLRLTGNWSQITFGLAHPFAEEEATGSVSRNPNEATENNGEQIGHSQIQNDVVQRSSKNLRYKWYHENLLIFIAEGDSVSAGTYPIFVCSIEHEHVENKREEK